MRRLERIFVHVLGQCADLKAEDVLILSDFEYDRLIIDALRAAIRSFGARPITLTVNADRPSSASIPRAVVAAMRNSDLVLLCTHGLLPQGIRKEATETGARLISMSGVNRKIVQRCFSVDYEELSRVTRSLAKILQSSREVTVTTPVGTNFTAQFSGRKCVYLDGIANAKGQLTSLPAGVVAAAPLEGTARGTLMIDGSVAGVGILNSPIGCDIENGRIVEISGNRQASKLKSLLSEGDENGFCVAEVGAGTNPRAKYSGNLLEDERVYASGHVGFGRNTHLGGTIESKIHIDATVKRPEIRVDGQEIISFGRIKVP